MTLFKNDKAPIWFHVLVIFSSIGVGLLSYTIGHQIITSQAQSQQQVDSIKFLRFIEKIADTTANTLIELNDHPAVQCDESALLHMRRSVFRSRYLKDIGMFEGDYLVCTTGLGVLPTKLKEPAAEYIDANGYAIWPNRKLLFFDQRYEAIIIKLGNYNAVIDPQDIEELLPQIYAYEVIFKNATQIISIIGQKGLYQSTTQQLSQSNFTQSLCSQEIPFCISLKLESNTFNQLYSFSLTILATLSGILLLVSYAGGRYSLARRYSLLTRISRGLKRDRFFPEFQPLVNISSGKIIGCEVLARYKDSKGMIPPTRFIPIIREKHSTWTFTEKMLMKAFEELSSAGDFPQGFKVNVNIFPQDISSGMVERLIDLQVTSKYPFKIGLEITEDQELELSSSQKIIRRLNDAGFTLAVDDFGTGYSNLNQLKNLNCDTLKIDRSFINEMEDGSIRSTLIPHIVSIANKLSLEIVAEGIENETQRSALLKENIRIGQGWLFGKPMSAINLMKMFNDQQDSE